MKSMLECRVGFGHCGRLFPSPALYRIALTKKVEILVSMFRFSHHFRNASADAIHMSRLSLLEHWYRLFIVSGAIPKQGHSLVEASPHWCIIFNMGRVLLIIFLMKCDICTVVLYCAYSNIVRSINSQSAIWVSFLSVQYWIIWCLGVS